jgi:iron uptake system component EfeO
MTKYALALVLIAACSSSPPDYQTDVVNEMHDSIDSDLANLVTGAKALQAAAPTHAWDATADAAAISAMQTAWLQTRTAYEHVEGATAPIFPEFDQSMDNRYDDFLTELGSAGDSYLFDDVGVTGMHAIERILYANVIPQKVIDFESTLPGYVAASFPTTDAEAMDFQSKLCQKLIDDAQSLHDQWTPTVIDVGAAYQGLVGLMNEQAEKVNLAATGEEESRYAQTTLFDLRNNLDGTTKIYDYFQPWIASHSGGDAVDSMIQSGFGTLSTLYMADPGNALPAVPSDWSSDDPSQADLQSQFGMLWESVHQAVDPTTSGSVVFEMNMAATMLGFPQFVED